MAVTAACPLRLHAVHAPESVNVHIVVGGVKIGLAAPGSRGGVLLVSSIGVVVASVEEASRCMMGPLELGVFL